MPQFGNVWMTFFYDFDDDFDDDFVFIKLKQTNENRASVWLEANCAAFGNNRPRAGPRCLPDD